MKEAKGKILILIILSVICLKVNAQSFHFVKPIFLLNVSDYSSNPHRTFSTQNYENISRTFKYEQSNPKKSYMDHLPLFCRMEELIFKQSGVNLRINLGSNDDVRKLEGKY